MAALEEEVGPERLQCTVMARPCRTAAGHTEPHMDVDRLPWAGVEALWLLIQV